MMSPQVAQHGLKWRSSLARSLLVVVSTIAVGSVRAQEGSGGNNAELAAGFYNITPGGGRWLTYTYGPVDLGEPLNLIISGNSDPYICTKAGIDDYFLSIQYGYTYEFMQNVTGAQAANLGDGNGPLNQTETLRYNYFDVINGALQQSIIGGNHLRYWQQNGPLANSGAWFCAASVELSLSELHMIVPNGYDLGRDWIVGNATRSNGTISPRTNRTFSATVETMQVLPANSAQGIKHNITTDGKVAILTVRLGLGGAGNTHPTDHSSSGAPLGTRFASKYTWSALIIMAGSLALLL